jgi:hypothetical protein
MKRAVNQRTGGASDIEQYSVRHAPDCPVGHPDSLRREAHDGCSRAVAPDCLGNGRI